MSSWGDRPAEAWMVVLAYGLALSVLTIALGAWMSVFAITWCGHRDPWFTPLEEL